MEVKKKEKGGEEFRKLHFSEGKSRMKIQS